MTTPNNQPPTNTTTTAWTVWRSDDNGNRFIVQEHLPESEAHRLVSEFTARGHKQLYWAEQTTPSRPQGSSTSHDGPARIETVLVQKQNGEFASPNSYAAWRGFSERGLRTAFYEWPALRDGSLPITPSTLVVGGSGAVRHALTQLGIPTPTINDLPEPLASFRGRRIRHSTLADIRGLYNDRGPSLFVKPLLDPKAFPARVISSFRDLIPTAHLPDEMPVLVSDPVRFLSEWRFFILHGRIVGTGWYDGDPLLFPDPTIVTSAVRTWGSEAPAGYGIDFGVTDDRSTLLVEVNEGYSLGYLGLNPPLYSQILEARWMQLMSGASRTA